MKAFQLDFRTEKKIFDRFFDQLFRIITIFVFDRLID